LASIQRSAAKYQRWPIRDTASCPYRDSPTCFVYRADTLPASIVRFVHMARDLPLLLADLRDPPDLPEEW
jgi:hypothetical protein